MTQDLSIAHLMKDSVQARIDWAIIGDTFMEVKIGALFARSYNLIGSSLFLRLRQYPE